MLGCDIAEISRIRISLEKFGEGFLKKILTEREIEIYTQSGAKPEFIAGRFAAKEAVAKALGTGMCEKLWFTDIEILKDDKGKPIVFIRKERRSGIEVSISHSRENAIAVCLIRGEL